MTENSNTKRPGHWERSYNFEVDATSHRHLRFFVERELEYYNSLINDINMRMRAFPEELCAMRGTHERLWSAVAFFNANLRNLVKVDTNKWPEILKSSATFLPQKNGKLVLEDKKFIFFDALSVPGKIHPQMRRALASEVLKTAMMHADQLMQAQRSNTGQMRSPVQMLMPADLSEKRHVQLACELVDLKWNAEKRQTEVTVPYTDKPLIVKDLNITDEKFNLMILRQQARGSLATDAQWQIVLINTASRYLLEMREQNGFARKRKAA